MKSRESVLRPSRLRFAKWLLGFAVLVAQGTAAAPASADGGYFSGNKGARAAGRAGAFAAKADDLMAVHYNPAGLAKLDTTLIQIGDRIGYNSFAYTRAATLDYGVNPAPVHGFDQVQNQQLWQGLDPLLGVATNFGLKDWGFALAAYSPPGISRLDFPEGGGQRYMMVNREAIILDYSLSAAWKYRDVFGFGVSLQWIHLPRLVYSLVIDGNTFNGVANPVASAFDMRATTKGSDPFTFNAIVGLWVRPTPALELAVSGQVIPSEMVAKSTLEIAPVNPLRVGDITLTRGPQRTPANDVTVTLPLPLLARVGARYRNLVEGRERFDVELDVEYETWSRVKSFALESNGLQAYLPAVSQRVNIGHIDLQKNWRDTIAIKLGGDFAVVPGRLTVRGGAYYQTAVADPAYQNVDFPSGQQIGGALGASLFLGHVELAAAYEARIQPRVSVSEQDARVYQQVPGSLCTPPYTGAACNSHYLGQPGPAVNAGTYAARSQFVSLDAIYRF